MGARATAKLKEIEDLRSSLRSAVGELEGRIPPVARLGRKALIAMAGTGAGGGALWLAGRRRSKRKRKAPAAAPATSVVVNVLPRGAVPVALGIAAVWAGLRVWDAVQRHNAADERPRPAVVHPMPEGRQGAG